MKGKIKHNGGIKTRRYAGPELTTFPQLLQVLLQVCAAAAFLTGAFLATVFLAAGFAAGLAATFFAGGFFSCELPCCGGFFQLRVLRLVFGGYGFFRCCLRLLFLAAALVAVFLAAGFAAAAFFTGAFFAAVALVGWLFYCAAGFWRLLRVWRFAAAFFAAGLVAAALVAVFLAAGFAAAAFFTGLF